ncbi:putative cyclic phosphodiesterase, U6 snRNA phosphodiesterase Usb1 [Helianthus annuus]|uniref:U6 snRNA phosphodiesterase n=1 Tax=Helianthus annuus TaxID=4232 RepID=A0A251U826_HELAN|nr:U6 snRNA phosphodiesterase [Helianthus annuus]KAF5795135.1 putative cyclic phosphodiesterase, U6 snRNA phosphodiesterase Usb1 [Helianthus annuus]KAJ0546619.1 putative cyclic phosphodiesterase, U6 snRNA phosphodiesterase Usb1 [Helianthus annuus]KAJ0553314.1 putative cyclic phosphodiesterase, U6 snRNA phosphodiesterase Usb1 [Helianthus annuus]KAJ0722225.1 putative cyclic phosphodiesterase, U6 snRNA phosphodiesterase Usb1 [Helianthus annuus]KAJ0897614.1 putative cyclic phosphodiesterase, U6 sn
MEALIASYGDSSSDSESESQPPIDNRSPPVTVLPPPPIDLLNPPNTLGTFDYLERNSDSRIRSFPHIEGNYALHVYIPVFIPSERKKELTQFLKKATSLVQGLHVVDIDVPLHMLLKDEEKMVQAALGREFHISLGRTVPIRVHQIDSAVAMLRQKLQFQKRYLIDFNKWEVFVNDDKTRTFLSIENTTGGLAEITKQIQAVNEVYKLHNLPEFYKDPRPHISIAWAVGDISQSLKRVVEGEMKTHINVGGLSMRSMFTCKFSNIVCKVGNKTYNICGSQGQ